MISRNTWILLVILLALIGASLYLTNQKTKQAASATPTIGSNVVFDSILGTPVDIKIQSSSGQSVEVARDATGQWVLKSPVQVAADQASAEAAATQLASLRILGDVQLGPDIVGLDKPADTLTVKFSAGTTHTLIVGAVNPIQTGYYAQLDNGKTQIVDKPAIDALLGLLTSPPYAATLTPTATSAPTATPTPAILPSATPALPTPNLSPATATP
jgi:Domain of unknown function (DUF4340)